MQRPWLSLLAATVVLAAGCLPSTSPPLSGETAGSAPSRPKTIAIGIQRGLPDFSPFSAQSTGGSAAKSAGSS